MDSSDDQPRGKSKDKAQKRALGLAGELLAERLLQRARFTEIRQLNEEKTNFEFADLFAIRDGIRYAISVKARNRFEWNGGKENPRFKLGKVSPPVDQLPRCRGLAARVCRELNAVGAWVIIRYQEELCDAYFGTLEFLDARQQQFSKGPATAVLTGPKHLHNYELLAKDEPHGIDYSLIRNFA